MEWIDMENILLSVICLLVTLNVHDVMVAGLDCGYPGSPAFGRPHPIKETYRPGEAVSFTCAYGYTLQGPMQRYCTINGTWAGPLPLCDRSLSSVQQQASSRQTLTLYPPIKVIDGDPRTCTYTDKVKPRWVRVDMRESQKVRAVAITVPTGIYAQDAAQLTIFVISVQDSTTATYHKCASFNGRFSATTLKLPCAGGEVEGRYIHIQDERNRVDYFSLCEIQVFVNKGSYECGEPERPAHAYSVKTELGAVNYRCVYGYRLVGLETRHCLQDGQWSDHQPICEEIVCPPLDEVVHGRIHYVGRKTDRLTLGTIANVTCDYGYRVSGHSLQCNEYGRWTEGVLACLPIDCGVPLSRHESEQHVLLNGTIYGSVALVRCGGKEENLVCREDGSWSQPEIDCPDNTHSALSKLGLVEEENDVPLGIVIGMVVAVVTLLLLLIIILIMKRRKILRRSSTDSLPSKETGSTLATSSPQPYENDAFYATIPVDNGDDSGDKKKNFMSTILFTHKKTSTTSDAKSSAECASNSAGSNSASGCIYEEIGINGKNAKKVKISPEAISQTVDCGDTSQPVYAQVDLEEKRRSRLVKSLCERFDPVDPPPWEGSYRAEEAPSFDEVDLEPIKLRELPPIPDDNNSDITYASLCIPLDPPTLMRNNEIYEHSSASTQGNTVHMKENELYLARPVKS